MTSDTEGNLIKCTDCSAYLLQWYHKCRECGNDFDKWDGWKRAFGNDKDVREMCDLS